MKSVLGDRKAIVLLLTPALLVTGQMSPEEFMTVVQDALDQG